MAAFQSRGRDLNFGRDLGVLSLDIRIDKLGLASFEKVMPIQLSH